MKSAKLLFSFILFSLAVQSQKIDDFLVYDQKEIDKFLKSTTYVLLDQHKESDYSLALTEAVKKHWKITKFEIIDKSTYLVYVKDKTKSFLTREYITGYKDLISLNLFMGGQRQLSTKGKLLATVKLKHYTATDHQFLYKMPTIVQNIQWQVTTIKNLGIEGENGFQTYFKSQRHIKKSRTLYVLNEHLTSKVKSLEDMKKYYKYDVTLVEQEQLKRAINEQDTNVIYLSIVAPTKNWSGQKGYYRVYSANDGETLIKYNRSVSSSAPLGVTGYDLKTFNK